MRRASVRGFKSHLFRQRYCRHRTGIRIRTRTRTVPHPQRTRIRTVLGRKTVVLRSETYLRRKNYREGGRWGGGMISSRVQRWALPSQ